MMFRARIFAMGACSMMLVSSSGCRNRSFQGGDVHENPGAGLSLAQFFEGLNAAPGSAARVRSGRELAAWIGNVGGDGAARSVYGLTAEYLQAPALCAPSEKVRLYRGIGAAPLIRPQGAAKGVDLMDDWEGLLINNLKAAGVAFAWNPDPGESIYGNLDKAGPLRGYKLEEITAQRWSATTMFHTVSSRKSPLVSTSLLKYVAQKFSGSVNSVQRYLVLDVCPERAHIVTNSTATKVFDEAEVYVPFFILPEEITAIVEITSNRHTGAVIGERIVTGSPDALSESGTQGTRAIRACYFNFDTPFERERDVLHLWLPPAYAQQVYPAWTRKLESLRAGERLVPWRGFVTGLSGEGQVCKPSCQRAADFVARGQAQNLDTTAYRQETSRLGCGN